MWILSPRRWQEQAVTERTTLILLMEVLNQLLRVVDLEAVTALGPGGAGSTVAAPYHAEALGSAPEHGADLAFSLTKYFGGHSDITGGSVTGSRGADQKVKSGRRCFVVAWLSIRPGWRCVLCGP